MPRDASKLEHVAPHIRVAPGVRCGQPTIDGTRITPADAFAFWKPGEPLSTTLVRRMYPDLSIDQALAAVAFEAGRQYERHEGRDELRQRLLGGVEDVVNEALGIEPSGDGDEHG